MNLYEHFMFIALCMMRDRDGSATVADVFAHIQQHEWMNVPKEDKEGFYANGEVRWKARIHSASYGFRRAEFLRKERGVWYLTAEGEAALDQGEEACIQQMRVLYGQWRQNNRQVDKIALPEADNNAEGSEEVSLAPGVERYQDTAMAGIEEYVRALGPYPFQDLCAALLRGMGYHVRDVAKRGPDGGIDIVAYVDSLGARPPRIKAQVKHHATDKTSVATLSELAGRLNEGDIGLFVSSAGFVAGCRDFARNSGKHLELIDLPRFIELWREHYDELSEEDKSLLPLQTIYFLDERRVTDE